MNLERCENGHFYDGDLYATCPHCNPQIRNVDETKNLTSIIIDDPPMPPPAPPIINDDDVVTIGQYEEKLGVEPVVGWLVCIEGVNIGVDYRLKSGRNFLGRAQSMDVAIKGDNSVSRDRHAILVYEPKSHTFLVQAGESKELCYLNDKVVLTADEIKANDILTVGETKLMFFPCCSNVFNWEMVKMEGEE